MWVSLSSVRHEAFNLWFIASQSEVQVTTWTWNLASWAGGGHWSLQCVASWSRGRDLGLWSAPEVEGRLTGLSLLGWSLRPQWRQIAASRCGEACTPFYAGAGPGALLSACARTPLIQCSGEGENHRDRRWSRDCREGQDWQQEGAEPSGEQTMLS